MTALVKYGMSEHQIERSTKRLNTEWHAQYLRDKGLNDDWRHYHLQVEIATKIFNESCEKAHREFIENQKP